MLNRARLMIPHPSALLRPAVGALLGLAVILGGVRGARADDATEAKLRFDRGVAFIERGEVRQALDEFFVSNRLSPNPTATYNIAACLEALERFAEAFSTYSAYLEGFELGAEERSSGRAALARILPKVARLSVRSTPPGAAIFVDRPNLGQYGVTPRTLAHEPGEHTVIAVLSGHHRAERKVTLARGELTEVALELAPIEETVRIDSAPPGAQVRIGRPEGPVVGTTPLQTRLALGERRIFLALDGYEARREVVDVVAGGAPALSVTMRKLPAPTGRLRVLTNVPNALVRVNGEASGYTPLVVELPGGAHQISVERRGYTTWLGPVGIVPERPLVADVTLRSEDPPRPAAALKWVLGATAATAVLLGAGVGVSARQAAQEFDDNPTRARFDDTNRLNAAADALFGVALLTGVATGVLLLTADTPSSESTVHLSHAEAP